MPTAGAALRSRLIVAGSFSISRARVDDRRRAWSRRRTGSAAARRQVAQDAPDVGQEAHVQHPVGLVEDEHLEALQRRVGLAEVVEQPARGGHDDVDAPAERVLLRAHAHAAEHRGARQRSVHGQRFEVLLDLGGQLARRGQDEGAGGAARLVR